MSTIVSWLSGVKLTITEWLGITASATIGALVIALRLQGSKLHAAQVALLANQMASATQKDDEAVAAARVKYEAALKLYEAAQ